MPNSTEVMSPVVAVTACIPSRKANAEIASIGYTNGIIMASVAAPPSPGRMPTSRPTPMPTSMMPNVWGASTSSSAAKKTLNPSGPSG